TAVDDHDLELVIGLREHALEGGAEEPGAVLDRHQYGDDRSRAHGTAMNPTTVSWAGGGVLGQAGERPARSRSAGGNTWGGAAAPSRRCGWRSPPARPGPRLPGKRQV